MTMPRKLPKNLRDKVILYLVEVEGCRKAPAQEYESRTRTKLISPEGDNVFVGSSGGVRRGRVISTSRSITDFIHAKVKAWAAQIEASEKGFYEDFE